MWIDPRIKGRLRELLEGFYQGLTTLTAEQLLQRANDALTVAGEEKKGYEIAAAKLAYASALGENEEFVRAETLQHEVLEYAEQHNQTMLAAIASYNAALTYQFTKGEEHREPMLLNALQNCKDHSFAELEYRILASLITYYIKQGKISEAFKTTDRLKQGIETTDPGAWEPGDFNFANRYVELGFGQIYQFLGEYAKSLSHFQNALATVGANEERLLFLVNRALISGYTNLGQYEEGVSRSLDLLNNNSDRMPTRDRVDTLRLLCACLTPLGRLDEADKAISEAETLMRASESNDGIPFVLAQKASLRLAQNDSEGVSIFNDLLAFLDRSGKTGVINLSERYNEIAEYYRRNRNFELAYDYSIKSLSSLGEEQEKQRRTLALLHESQSKELLAQEKRIFEIELEQNKNKLQHQERELTLTASQLATQAELLGNFRNDLRKIVRDMADPIDALRHIKQKLKDLPCEQIDWAKFEAEFISVHPEFRQKLLELFPDLTSQETKMCLLVRLGLKNTEIARLLCLSERTVDNHRFNLRKKLGLKTAQSLSQFLIGLK